MTLILLAAALLSSAPAARPETIFACKLGARSATVSLNGKRFTYRYGTVKKAELTVTGTATSGNLHGYSGRYASILSQLRFNVGDVSYVLYTMDASRAADSSAVSGLTVVRGGKVLSDRPCKPFATFRGGFAATSELPQDDDKWSAMSLE
jgi:hypothetical protein